MKKLFFFSLLFIYFSGNLSVFGQVDKEDRQKQNILSYNKVLNDWDLVIPIDQEFLDSTRREGVELIAFIIVNSNFWVLPAEVTDRGVELMHPSDFTIWEGREYSFCAFIFNYESGFLEHKTDWFEFFAPKLNLKLQWNINNQTLRTEGIMSASSLGMNLNYEESYFYTVEQDIDSILYGQENTFPVMKGMNLLGEKTFTEGMPPRKQFVGLAVRLDNDDGEPKLYGHILSTFLVEGFLVVTNNPVGVGPIMLYTYDNMPRQAIVYDSMGRYVDNPVLVSGEMYWLPTSTKSGVYYIRVPGIGTAEIVKIVR